MAKREKASEIAKKMEKKNKTKYKCPLCKQNLPKDFNFAKRWKEMFKEEGISDKEIHEAFSQT